MSTGICIAGRKAMLAKNFLAATTLLAILKAEPGRAAGGSWSTLGPEGARVESIVVDTGDTVYAATNGMGFARLGPDGKFLAGSNEGLMSSIVLSLAVDPHDANTVYAGTGGSGVFKSADGGKHWKIGRAHV